MIVLKNCFVIGIIICLSNFSTVNCFRIRRQSDFLFPPEFESLGNNLSPLPPPPPNFEDDPFLSPGPIQSQNFPQQQFPTNPFLTSQQQGQFPQSQNPFGTIRPQNQFPQQQQTNSQGRFPQQQQQGSQSFPAQLQQQGSQSFPAQPQQQQPNSQGRLPQQPGQNTGSISNNNNQQGTTTENPANMMVTTPSPSFLACFGSCPTTSEYNPICGTNRQLYQNQQKFDCALRCGAQVQIWRRGSCAGLFNMMRG